MRGVRDGFLVDDMKFPVFQRPGLHGDAWYNKNKDYSLDCQISTISMFQRHHFYLVRFTSLSLFQITFFLLTIQLVTQGASMIHGPFKVPAFVRSTSACLRLGNGCGLTRRTHPRLGVLHHSRNLLAVNSHLINAHITTMYQRYDQLVYN